ncbi:MAG: hypothetical protein JWQ45_2343 [Blastococcus sp.]|jgi:hypothetical protein|nr:hypothetical protein [Blastococcus sp.]
MIATEEGAAFDPGRMLGAVLPRALPSAATIPSSTIGTLAGDGAARFAGDGAVRGAGRHRVLLP